MNLALIGNLNLMEILVVVVAAIMIFGKDLPRVAARGAVQLGRLRRMMQQMWRETGIEKEIRDVEAEIRSAVPRDVRPNQLARIARENIERQLDPESTGGGLVDHGPDGPDGPEESGKKQDPGENDTV